MKLLVSVSNADEASAALAGGADVIDAKNPMAGPLGAVSLDELRDIVSRVNGARPVTAALGDASDGRALETEARCYAAAGASLVKLGFAGTTERDRVERWLAAAARGAVSGGGGVVAVAYADAHRAGSIAPGRLIEAAARAGATGVLLDTADKAGPGLRSSIAIRALRDWVWSAHQAGLLVALAGRLTADDFDFVREAGADIVGVRGAACRGGRVGRISTERVKRLRGRCEPEPVEAGIVGGS
jgi:(5-formylfuran-3-yl)methyl phosphate synthase